MLEMTVNEMIRRCPDTAAVFNRFGVDTCCGGSRPIREVAERHGMDPAELERALLAELEARHRAAP